MSQEKHKVDAGRNQLDQTFEELPEPINKKNGRRVKGIMKEVHSGSEMRLTISDQKYKND